MVAHFIGSLMAPLSSNIFKRLFFLDHCLMDHFGNGFYNT